MQISAQMENNDLPKNILSLLEKKVRNLEKRKGKLDFYKRLVDAGETLNEDQTVRLLEKNFREEKRTKNRKTFVQFVQFIFC